jgi:hypothetical protein
MIGSGGKKLEGDVYAALQLIDPSAAVCVGQASRVSGPMG